MELKLLKSFIAVATLKNFSAAARELNTVQPAISRHISELEEELGVSLLWRNTREVKITAAGQSLLKDAKIILEHEINAKEQTKRAAAGEIGTLRIGYIGSASFTFLPELVRKYSKLYPKVKVSLYEMSVQEQIEAFEGDVIDIGISRSLPKNLNLQICAEELYMDKLLAVVHENHRVSNAKEVDLEDLRADNFILFNRFEAPCIYDKILFECSKNNFIPNITSQPKTMQTVITEVASELGITIVPGCIKRLYIKGCKFIPIKNHLSTISTELHYKTDPMLPTVDTFVQMTLRSKKIITDNI